MKIEGIGNRVTCQSEFTFKLIARETCDHEIHPFFYLEPETAIKSKEPATS
ncbi:hypothetical protein JXJ21_20280 [candidate division KSB1 bacterium]|nr:hypothetical protein [candidate division KSB1 bacterium]